MVGIYLTCDNHPENGKPRSLENAQIWREEDARELIVIIINSSMIITTSAMVPPRDCVALEKT